MNISISSLMGAFVGHAIYVYLDYRTYPGLYDMQWAPWYTGILYYGIFTIVPLIIAVIIKLFIWRKLKQKKEEVKSGNRMGRNIKSRPDHLCIAIFTLCLSVRFVEYFLIETDKTAIGENVLHLSWSDIGFHRNGFVSGILKGLLLGSVCFAISYGLELAIFILQGNPAYLELYISSFSLTGSQIKNTGFVFFCYVYCSMLLMYGWKRVFFAGCLLKRSLKQSHL